MCAHSNAKTGNLQVLYAARSTHPSTVLLLPGTFDGATGPQGPAGVAPPSPAASNLVRFDKRGAVTINDARVRADSLMVLQYVGAEQRGLPTNVVDVVAGRFSATGRPDASFRYVIHAAA